MTIDTALDTNIDLYRIRLSDQGQPLFRVLRLYLEDIEELIAAASAIALGESELPPRRPHHTSWLQVGGYARRVSNDVRITQIRYNSPMEIVFAISTVSLAASGVAISARTIGTSFLDVFDRYHQSRVMKAEAETQIEAFQILRNEMMRHADWPESVLVNSDAFIDQWRAAAALTMLESAELVESGDQNRDGEGHETSPHST